MKLAILLVAPKRSRKLYKRTGSEIKAGLVTDAWRMYKVSP